MNPRHLTFKGQLTLEDLPRRVEAMKPGDTLTVTKSTPTALNSIRNYFYVWLNHTGQKGLFKTIRQTATSFIIIKEDFNLALYASSIRKEPKIRGHAFIKTHLLLVETFEKAQEIARAALDKGELTDEEFIFVLEEWKRRIQISSPDPTLDPTGNSPSEEETQQIAKQIANKQPGFEILEENWQDPTGKAKKGGPS